MRLKVLRFATILLAAFALTASASHVLELPQKMQYDAELYATVNSTLYRYHAVIGGSALVVSIVCAFALAYFVRRIPSTFELTLLGALCFALSFVLWLVIVAPVNAMVREAPDALLPAIWMHWRERWEYGHIATFVFQLGGFSALVLSILQERTARAHVDPRAPS